MLSISKWFTFHRLALNSWLFLERCKGTGWNIFVRLIKCSWIPKEPVVFAANTDKRALVTGSEIKIKKLESCPKMYIKPENKCTSPNGNRKWWYRNVNISLINICPCFNFRGSNIFVAMLPKYILNQWTDICKTWKKVLGLYFWIT